VQGFSSGRGQAAVENSQRMAESIVRYLVLNHEIPVYRIYTLGMGNAPVQASTGTAKAHRTTGGRVEVAVLKNGAGDLESMAAGQGSMSSAPAAEPSQTAAPSSSAAPSYNAAPASSPVGATSAQPAAGADNQQQPSPSAPASNQNEQPAQPSNTQSPR
jgi:hypothetical protein